MFFFVTVHPTLLTQISGCIRWMPNGCCVSSAGYPGTDKHFGLYSLLLISLVQTQVWDAFEKQGGDLRNLPHADPRGKSHKTVSRWKVIRPDWLQTSAGSRNAHRGYEMSGGDLWMGKGATFVTVLVSPWGWAEAECQGRAGCTGWVAGQGGGSDATLCSQRGANHGASPLRKSTWSCRGWSPGFGRHNQVRLWVSAGKVAAVPLKTPVLANHTRAFLLLPKICWRKLPKQQKAHALTSMSAPCVYVNIVNVKGSTCFVWGDIIPVE